MHSAPQTRASGQTRKPRGRLNRETLNKLGKVLEAYFDDVRSQGVPDRFKQLLNEYAHRQGGSPEESHKKQDED
jgi:hypothetical protein